MRIIRYMNRPDFAIELQRDAMAGGGYTLYLVGYGKREYKDHTWVLSAAISRAYEILDTAIAI